MMPYPHRTQVVAKATLIHNPTTPKNKPAGTQNTKRNINQATNNQSETKSTSTSLVF